MTILTVVFATAAISDNAGAVTKIWTGGTSNDWTVATNWSPSGAPTGGDSVQFPFAGSNRSITLVGNRTVADVTFSSSGAYRFLDNQLTITSGDLVSALGNHRIDSSLVLGAEGAWSIPSGKLSVYGAVNSTTGNAFGIDKTGAGSLEFLNVGATNSLRYYLHQAGNAEFFEGTYTLSSTSFDSNSAIYMADGTVTISHRAKVKGTGGGNLVLQSVGAGSSNMIIRDEQTEVANFGQLFLGASGTSGNSLTVTHGAKIRDIGLLVAGFNGNATVAVADGATVNSSGVTVGMLTGVTSTLTVEDPSSALTTGYLALGGYNVSQKGGTGTATISDRASLAVSGDLRFFSSTSSLTVDAGSASIGALVNETGVVGSIKLRNDGGTPALTLTSPVSIAAPGPFTFDGVISNTTSGSGGIVKQGPGEQIFTKQNTYTGGTRIEAGTLTLGTTNTLAPTGAITAVGGTLNLGGNIQQAGSVTLQGGTIAGTLPGVFLPTSLSLQSGTLAVPTFIAAAVTKTTAGTVTVSAPLAASAINVNAGTLKLNAGATAPVTVKTGATLELAGTLNGALSGEASSNVLLSGDASVAGTITVLGTLNVGVHTFVNSSPADMNAINLTIAGGAIVSPTVTFGSVSGHGLIQAAPTAFGSNITASGGALSIGDPQSASGFQNFGGVILANDQTVNLLSAGVAQLGSSTVLSGGRLSTLHGAALASGRTLQGFGHVDGAFANQGTVNGTSGVNPIAFTGSVSGAGSYAGNVRFDGSFSPGNSPAAISFAGDATLANSSLLLIEIGGDDEGTEYDHLDVSGKLTLGGTMAVSFINGFTPTGLQTFDIFDFGTIVGDFNALNLPTVSGLAWNVSRLGVDGTLSLNPIYAADFDSNGRVDAVDLTILRTSFGSTTAGRAMGDANGDGFTNGADFLVWQRQLGSGVTATPTSATIPEPASLLLVVLALPLLRRRSL